MILYVIRILYDIHQLFFLFTIYLVISKLNTNIHPPLHADKVLDVYIPYLTAFCSLWFIPQHQIVPKELVQANYVNSFLSSGLGMHMCSNVSESWGYLRLLENCLHYIFFFPEAQNRPVCFSKAGYSWISFMDILQLIYGSKVSLQSNLSCTWGQSNILGPF